MSREQVIDRNAPTGKVYTDQAVWIGTFVGGPLVTGYFMAENYKRLGQSSKVLPTWIIAILSTLAVMASALLVPESAEIPYLVHQIIPAVVAYGVFKGLQDKAVKAHIKAGGLHFGWARIFGFGVAGAILTIVPILSYSTLFQPSVDANLNLETKVYGKMMPHEILYDPANISEQEIDQIAAGLRELDYFDSSVSKYIYTKKQESTFEIYLSTVPGIEGNQAAIYEYKELRRFLDAYLPNNDVAFFLTVQYYENVKVSLPDETPLSS